MDHGYPVDKKEAVKQTCAVCHTGKTIEIVDGWIDSKHSMNMVSCAVCHGSGHNSEENIDKAEKATSDKCIGCHQMQYDQISAGKHGYSLEAVNALPGAHGKIGSDRKCDTCHVFTAAQVESEAIMDIASDTCTTCHKTHSFSLEEAGKTSNCMPCHEGLNQLQGEVYASSKHGELYKLKQKGELSSKTKVPTCATCHMRDGQHHMITAWGFYGLQMEPPKDDEWLKSRRLIFQAMGIENADGMPGFQNETVKKISLMRLNPDEWKEERGKMIKTCKECHSGRETKRFFKAADNVIKAADILTAEAVRTIFKLYDNGILEKPDAGCLLFPDISGSSGKPTAIENRLNVMFFESRMTAIREAFHNNPEKAAQQRLVTLKQDLDAILKMAAELQQ